MVGIGALPFTCLDLRVTLASKPRVWLYVQESMIIVNDFDLAVMEVSRADSLRVPQGKVLRLGERTGHAAEQRSAYAPPIPRLRFMAQPGRIGRCIPIGTADAVCPSFYSIAYESAGSSSGMNGMDIISGGV